MNRPAQLTIGLGNELGRRKLYSTILSSPGTNSAKKSNKRLKYSFLQRSVLIFFVITADGKLSIQLPTSYFVPKPQL